MVKKDVKVLIICMKTGAYGLSKDVEILETALKERAMKASDVNLMIEHVDPRTTKIPWADVAFHIEVPCRLAVPYARKHYFMVNPEWWYKEEWKWTAAVEGATFIQRYPKAINSVDVSGSPVFTLLWRAPAILPPPVKKIRQRTFVCFLGASKHKLAAALEVVAIWPANAPLLKIWGSADVIASLSAVCTGRANIILSSEHISNEDVLKTLSNSEFCLLPSQAEGFGYALCDAMQTGCLPLWSDVPAYRVFLDDVMGSNGQMITAEGTACEFLAAPRPLKTKSFEIALQLLLEMPQDDIFATRNRLIAAVNERTSIFRQHTQLLWNTMLRDLEKMPVRPGFGAPPSAVLVGADGLLPRVGVITLTWNRPHWMKLAFQTILAQSWPLDRLVWTIVDDGSFGKRVDVEVTKFAEQNPRLKIEYVSLGKKTHIGGKRNRGIRRVLENHPDTAYFCMMDDDDVYFPHAIRDRVAWLASTKKGACYASVLPLYDLTTYTSAINVPPLNLGPAKRCSEASMAFTTEFWKAREFPNTVSMAEGEAFLAGREMDMVEIVPQGVIVSLLHAQNTSSRGIRAAADNKEQQNGCHYGFSDEFFLFLHGLGTASVSAAAAAAEEEQKAKQKAAFLAAKEEREKQNSLEQPVTSAETVSAEPPVVTTEEPKSS
jgi:glycosyltransferase involved in cell wall biosynthesis